MSAALPPFSGDDTTCTKCGHEGATTEYRAHGECVHGCDALIEAIGFQPNERLHRECARCGHEWDEAIVQPAAEASDG